MKNIILLCVLLSTLTTTHAQFQVISTNGGETSSSIGRIGIGDYAALGDINARLHINNYLLFQPAGSLNGLLFRTDGDQSIDNRWQMFTGTSSTAQTERFRIRTLAGGFDTYLERTQSGSEADIRLLTAEVQIRARGKRLGDFCELAGPLADEVIMGDGSDVNFTALSNTNRRLFYHGGDGYLGVGSNFTEGGLIPNFNVHVHDSENDSVYIQITNANTGSLLSDGLLLGLNPTSGNSEIRSRDVNRWFDILESDTVRMRFRDVNSINVWPYNTGTISYTGVNRIMVPLRASDANTIPRSMMQLGTLQDGNIGRAWQNIGTTYGGNEDAMYIGLLERANPGANILQTDAVITWGCQEGNSWNSIHADNFRIMFLTPVQANDVDSSGSAQGKEVLRINPLMGNVGIGNFSANSLQGPGTLDYVNAKLDVDGDLRIREVIQNDTLNQILVRDPNDHGRVRWRDVGTITGDCEWNIVANGTSNDLTMGYAGACNTGNTGIGLSNPAAKLDVYKNSAGVSANQTALKVALFGGTLTNYGAKIDVAASPSGPNTITYGVAATSQGGYDKNFGGHFEAISITGSMASTGIYAYATTPSATATHMGSYGSASYGRFNYGVRGHVLSNSYFAEGIGVDGRATAGYNFGIGNRPLFGVRGVADAANNCGYRPIGVYGEVLNISSNCPGAFAGYFNGNVYVNGDVTANSFTTSDASLKENIQDIENALETIGQLHPVTYNYRCADYPQLNLLDGNRHGFIAQEAEQVIPGITKSFESLPTYDEEGNELEESTSFLAMNYNELHALEVASIKELMAKIDLLQAQIDACCVNADTRSNFISSNQYDVRLSNNNIVLNQNSPNPFAEITSITYRIDQPFSKAAILFHDANGHLIQSVDILSVGSGQLNVFADDLSNGMYSYTLVVDGNVIDSKKMVKE